MFDFATKTDTGNVRIVNEDSLIAIPEKGIFAVADGVGGQQDGDIASKTAVELIKKFTEKQTITIDNFEQMSNGLFIKIDNEIAKFSTNKKSNAATTLVFLFVSGGEYCIANIGDSRGYLIKEDDIIQITDDQSYVNELVKAGEITKQEAKDHPSKNIITKALGLGDEMLPDLYYGKLNKGEKILLASDGLTNELRDAEIFDIIKNNNIKDSVEHLMKEVKSTEAKDNISIVLLKEE